MDGHEGDGRIAADSRRRPGVRARLLLLGNPPGPCALSADADCPLLTTASHSAAMPTHGWSLDGETWIYAVCADLGGGGVFS